MKFDVHEMKVEKCRDQPRPDSIKYRAWMHFEKTFEVGLRAAEMAEGGEEELVRQGTKQMKHEAMRFFYGEIAAKVRELEILVMHSDINFGDSAAKLEMLKLIREVENKTTVNR